MKLKLIDAEVKIEENYITEEEPEIRGQLEDFLSGDRKSFDLEIRFPENFTGKVMREIAEIPYGETASYGEIAEKLDSSAVAVGQACGRNPVPLIIPCHRVVGKTSLGGYGYGRDLKEKLLVLESS